MLDVIGAGLGRTGTRSLAAALERLGFGPSYHMFEKNRNPEHIPVWMDAIDGKKIGWKDFLSPYRSTVEWPAVAFLPQILPVFPEAKVILTLRDPEEWFESASETVFDALELSQYNPDPARRSQSEMSRKLILEETFSGGYRDKEHAIEVYQKHIQDVIEMTPADRLLLYRVTEGWKPLCEFLGVEEPNETFPWTNQRTQFLSTEPEWAREIRKKRSD